MDWSIIFLIFIGIIIFNIITEKKHIIKKNIIISNLPEKKLIIKKNIVINNLPEKKKVNFSEPEFTILNIPARPQISNDNDIPEPIDNNLQVSEFTDTHHMPIDILFENLQNAVSLEAFASPKQSYNLF
jgi:hypothetical protein